MRIVVTAGKRGAFGFFRGEWAHCPSVEVKVQSTAGAGDALLAGVIAGLAAGLPFFSPGTKRARINDRPLLSALDLGVLVAGFTVTSPHTIHPDLNLQTVLAFADSLDIKLDEKFRAKCLGGNS